jgi:two-component system sensor histidine kinase DesK
MRRGNAAPVLVGVVALITFVSTVWINPDLMGMWIYLGTSAGLALPIDNKMAQRGLLAAVAGVSLAAWHDHAKVSDWLSLMFPTFFAGLATIGIRQMAGLIGELREARAQVASLAANEERLRLARDLHDLTGHSLSMITLKAELAQRMIEKSIGAADSVPPSGLGVALKEVTEIEQVSRQTLADIREAVSGYRRPTLAVELASACAALDAAGIKLDADPDIVEASGSYDPDVEAVLAWCLREAVTNAIRHSGATRVRVRVEKINDELVLNVLNDGRGLAQTAGSADGDHDGDGDGNGLRGLRERLDAVDGRISVGGTDGDFRLIAAVPLAS